MINTYIKAGLLGMFAGMRSMAGPAVISQAFTNKRFSKIRKSPLRFLGNSGVSKALRVMTLGELIIDKFPKIPARTASGLLITRASAGGLSGAAVSLAEKRNVVLGSLIGITAAVGAAYLFKNLREKAGTKSRTANTIAGLAEDAVLIGSGLTVLNKGF